jgi:hypothetical protein
LESCPLRLLKLLIVSLSPYLSSIKMMVTVDGHIPPTPAGHGIHWWHGRDLTEAIPKPQDPGLASFHVNDGSDCGQALWLEVAQPVQRSPFSVQL